MTINLTARGTRLTVGGKDFSSALVEGSVSDALLDQSGVVLRSGSIELARVAGLDESLDPRLNLIRWARGVEVLIELRTEAGTWAQLPCGPLYILNAQPNDSQGARLTLELGCWFSLNEWQTSTDPEDEREITEAESVPRKHLRQTLLVELLGKLGVTGVSGATLAGDWIGSIAADLQGGYLEQAGQLAYGSAQPCYLIAVGKGVQVVPIDLAPAPFHQVAIGVGEKAYEPQTAEPPVERYVCTANPLVEKPSSEWEREGSCVSRRYSDSSGSEFWQFCPEFPVSQETYRLEEPEVVLDPDSGGTGLRLSQRRVRQKTWAEDRRLLQEEEIVYRPRIAVLAGAYGELDQPVPNPWGTMIAERTVVTYSYDAVTRVLSQRRAVTQKTLAEIAPRIVAQYSLSANFTTLRDADTHVQQWFKDPQGRWVVTERKLRSRNLAQPQVVDVLEGRGTYDMLNVACNLVRVPLGEGGAQAAASGAAQPPATEYWSDQTEADKYEPKAIKGVAVFAPIGGSQFRPQKVVEAVPLAQTETALGACARVAGSLLLGRHQGASLQIPVADKFLGPGYLPLKRVDVVDRQSVKSFLADGATWAFSRTEALLGFAHLCWLGTAPFVAPTGVSGTTIQMATAGTGLVVGSELRFAAVPGGGLPPGLTEQPYWVVAVSPTGIQVATSPGGVPVLPGAPPPAPALPPADGLPLPGGGSIDPAPAFGGAAFVVIPATAITVPYVPESPPVAVISAAATLEGVGELVAGGAIVAAATLEGEGELVAEVRFGAVAPAVLEGIGEFVAGGAIVAAATLEGEGELVGAIGRAWAATLEGEGELVGAIGRAWAATLEGEGELVAAGLRGPVGTLYALARAKGSQLSPKDAAVYLAQAKSVEAGLAIVPDL